MHALATVTLAALLISLPRLATAYSQSPDPDVKIERPSSPIDEAPGAVALQAAGRHVPTARAERRRTFSLRAQTRALSAAALVAGSRVRLHVPTLGTSVSGTLVTLDGKLLTLEGESGPLRIPVDSVAGVELSLGRKRQWLKGLAVGALAGIGLGFAYSVDADNCGAESDNFCTRGHAVGASTAVWGGVGALIGAAIRTERWAAVDAATLRQTQIGEADQRSAPSQLGARTSSEAPRQNWVQRHPVLTGTLIGAGLGTAAGCASGRGGNPDITCASLGGSVGAGGALFGALIGLALR